MPRRVLITDYAWPSLDIEREGFAGIDADLIVATTGTEAELLELAPRADAIMVNWAPLTAAVLQAAGNCRIVARYGIGVDNIDVARATELGIPVSNVPEYCTDEVAEHTVALLLAQARHLFPFARQTRAGGWDNTAYGPMRRLRGSVLGVVGHGVIARAVVTRAAALGMRVLVHSRSLSPGPLQDGVVAVGDLTELLQESDFVSLHVPLNEDTRGMIDLDRLSLMKPHAYLVNTSRGGVIDAHALHAALSKGWLAGAALDVLDVEPPAAGDPLLALDSVHVTPHAAFSSRESVEQLQRTAVENVAAVLTGGPARHVVNPDVLEHPGRPAQDVLGRETGQEAGR